MCLETDVLFTVCNLKSREFVDALGILGTGGVHVEQEWDGAALFSLTGWIYPLNKVNEHKIGMKAIALRPIIY